MVNEKSAILKILIENKEEDFSILKLAKIRKINYKSAYQAIEKLKNEGIIECNKLGNTINCKFNMKFNQSVYLTEYQRREEFLKNKNFRVLYNELKNIQIFFIALIFGSYAKRTQNKHSDIDILVISENGKEIEEKLSLLPLKTHSILISTIEFIKMAKSKEFSVVSEAIKNNIILIGIEDYYRLLENVR